MKSLLLFLGVIAFQAQGGPARDTPAGQVDGTAVISGQVLSDDNPARPVRLAKVELSSSALRRQLMVTSDVEGRFVFPRLPAGRFTLTVSKPGYLSSVYGAKRPGGAGVPIVVATGEQVPVAVTIVRGAVIAGTVRDVNGEPAAGVRMQALAYAADSTGVRKLDTRTYSNSGNGLLMTDDRGMYRIYGLRPGEYYVQASPGSSGIGGTALSAAEVEWAQRTIAGSTVAAAAPPPGQAMTLAAVLYPGTPDPTAAMPITLKAGETREGVDFTFSFIPTATVSGVIRGPDGSPPRLAQASLVRPNASVTERGNLSFIQPDAEGRFSVSGVPPGTYALAVRGSMQRSAESAPGPMALASIPLWAMTEVIVSGPDVSGIELTLAQGLTVSGTLIFDGAKAPAPADVARVSVSLMPQGPTSMGAPAVVAKSDGTFVIGGVGPGEYKLWASVPAGAASTSPWSLKSAMVSNVDTLDASFVVRTDVTGAVITLTDRPTELTGTLLDAAGKPAPPQYFIVAFPVDRTHWRPESRRIRFTRPGNTGSFRIADLPPGEYYVCAMTDLEQELLFTPGYLEPLVAASIKLAFGDGEKKVQDLKIAR